MRKLSESFIGDLENDNGLLHSILERVKQDHTLMLAIRSNYINIYYRGGNLVRIEEQKEGSYRFHFDENYNIAGEELPTLPTTAENKDDTAKWVNAFPHLEEVMDMYFAKHNKPEREFQQLIARSNNFSNMANASEYFISDIEFADTELGSRFDMLAIRWLANQRKSGSNCRAALIEMKYGDNALGGDAGLIKHLRDMDALISDNNRFAAILETMESQFNQLDQLGLLNFRHAKRGTEVKLDAKDKPEVIFVLANHNPRSTILASILNELDITQNAYSKRFDLKFFVASFAGYGLHADCMLDLTQFRELLSTFSARTASVVEQQCDRVGSNPLTPIMPTHRQ